VRHKLGLCDWQVSGEIFWEVGGIEEEKAIRGLDQRLAAVGEFLAVARLGLSLIGSVCGDVNQCSLLWGAYRLR
jgi:hypothetical protein